MVYRQPFSFIQHPLEDPGIYIYIPKSNIDTENDGLENVSPAANHGVILGINSLDFRECNIPNKEVSS